MEKLFEISFPRVEMDIFNPCFKGMKGLFGNPKALSSLLFYLRTLFLFFSTYYLLSSTLTNVIVQLIDIKGTIGKYSCVIHLLNLSVQCTVFQPANSSAALVVQGDCGAYCSSWSTHTPLPHSITVTENEPAAW